MKKLVLLFTMLCANVLIGMEPTPLYELRRPGPLYPGMEKMGNFGELPEDIHNEIVKQAIESSNTLEKAIRAINVASALKGVRYDDLKDFTKLVHLLAHKFNRSTLYIAEQFKTQAAATYVELALQLMEACFSGDINIANIAQLIDEGADVNLTSRGIKSRGSVVITKQGPINFTQGNHPLLNLVLIFTDNIELITLLLKSGAQVQEPIDTEDRKLLEEARKQITQ